MAWAEGTRCVPLDMIEDGHNKRRALCPACTGGFLHPYEITVELGGQSMQDVGVAWVVVCKGSKPGERYRETGSDPCGFSTPITAYRHVPGRGLVAHLSQEGR